MSKITEDESVKWKAKKPKGIEYQGENLRQYTNWGEGYWEISIKATKNEWQTVVEVDQERETLRKPRNNNFMQDGKVNGDKEWILKIISNKYCRNFK